ncbi:MAG: DNA alkylation repair protein [Gemmatimonadetes bacterium]|nr:DNA alkylation repair protein [Gemmatimonadota bacterium]
MPRKRATSTAAAAGLPPAAAFATAREAVAHLEESGDPADARFLQRFFRTGPGEYGEGDRFLGIRVPVLRRLLPRTAALPESELDVLLQSEWHEARLVALLAMVRRYERGTAAERQRLYRLYLRRTDRINNWDLVDASAPRIVGAHLAERSRAPLHRLARSRSVWERRIAILATAWFIREGEIAETLAIAERLLQDRHDLIHKAVGWMLREAWKQDRAAGAFVAAHCREMPRTMLRYAIERQAPAARQRYLRGECAS